MAVSIAAGDTPDQVRRSTRMWGSAFGAALAVLILLIALGLTWLIEHPSFGARCAPDCIAVTGNPGAPGLRAGRASSHKLAGAASAAPASFSEGAA